LGGKRGEPIEKSIGDPQVELNGIKKAKKISGGPMKGVSLMRLPNKRRKKKEVNAGHREEK